MKSPSVAPVSLTELANVYRNMQGRVRYKLGAKAPSLTCDSHDIQRIDCSGWARYGLARATHQAMILPDGSQAQLEFCQDASLRKLAQYSDVNYAANDPSRLFIGFLSPSEGQEWPRHVWLIWQGKTMEAEGPENGYIHARPWNHSHLVACVNCFELPTVR